MLYRTVLNDNFQGNAVAQKIDSCNIAPPDNF